VVSFVVNALAHASYFMQTTPISKSQQEHKRKPVDSFLEEHCFIGSQILSQTGIFSEFSLFIITYHEEIFEAAMGGGRGRSAPFYVFVSLKRWGRAADVRVASWPKPISY
jgi:hypothetical protein